jgi:hypothetical protein
VQYASWTHDFLEAASLKKDFEEFKELQEFRRNQGEATI